jgi:hypothetical protein
MAGNRPGDNSGNILVDFDYNNIIVVDPNKTIDAFGNIAERLVDHENLVMYANLEAEVVPRTKLSVGGSPEDRIRTISVAKMNFLRPTEGTYLSTGYYDELTGKDAAEFLINYCMDNNKQLPDWFVHSDNTGGNKNIRQLLTNYMYRVEGRLDKMVDAYGYVNGKLIYNI